MFTQRVMTFAMCVALALMGESIMAAEAMYPKTEVDAVEVKEIPPMRALTVPGSGEMRVAGNDDFGKLFRYIRENDVPMTTPVETGGAGRAMSFFVAPDIEDRNLESTGQVRVERMPARTVVSVGIRGAYEQERLDVALARAEEWLGGQSEWRAAGSPYAVFWNSPMTPPWFKRSEVHVPVVQTQGTPGSIYDIPLTTITGEETTLEPYKGQVLLIVNTASKCGYTNQYEELESIHKIYRDRGFTVLGFPSNDFKNQEPLSNPEILDFCQETYGVTFPLFSKAPVTGEGMQPLYQFLTSEATNPEHAHEITWNFNKFLIARDGTVLGYYPSPVRPYDEALRDAIETALGDAGE